MTRVFVDTRSSRGCWVAAHAAGLCDLDVVALVTAGTANSKIVAQMRYALKRASAASRMSMVEIPCHTVDAVGVVKDRVRTARNKEPGIMLGDQNMPDVTIERVPVEKNAADRYIVRHIAPGDIVLTDDIIA